MVSIASESTTDAVGGGDVVSADMSDTLQDLSITEEPEAPQTLAEEEHDRVDHVDGSNVDDNDLPWRAQRSAFSDGELSCTHALLVALLPASLLLHLPTSPDRADLLNALSSGQLLCVAYNIGARQSRKPWGYINDESIHDIVALEDALRPPRPMGCKRRRSERVDGSDARMTYVHGARESSRSFYQIMCLELSMDMILSLQRPEAPLYATHHLPCLTRCTDDATESDVSDKRYSCGTISVDAQVLRIADLLRCACRRASRRRLGRYARTHAPLLDICVS